VHRISDYAVYDIFADGTKVPASWPGSNLPAGPMTADTPFRDISAPPAEHRSTRPTRPRRDEPYRPASDADPLLAAHGGSLTVDRLGTVPYHPTWELQDELAEQRRGRRIGDRLLLLEHFPVYTIGRGGDAANMLASPERLRSLGADLVRIDRGGDITFHGPGQIVAYPIVELRDPLDLRRYVRTLEAAIIATAAAFGVAGDRLEGHPGIWVEGERKLAAIGVRVKRGVTTHGLALNVNTDLRWFDEMVPCGIPDKDVTSLARESGSPVPMDAVEDELARQLADRFGLRLASGATGVIGPGGGREQ
jgi:lipoyl(octanoyl) transferase